MSSNKELSFNREQIKTILNQFILFFQSEECIQNLKQCTNEIAMENFIEEKQRQIIKNNHIDPIKGFSDLKKIPQFFKKDSEIMDLLLLVSIKEESVINIAINERNKNNKILHISEIYDEYQKVKNNPQLLQQFLLKIPNEERQIILNEIFQNISPEQRQLIEQQFSSNLSYSLQIKVPSPKEFLKE